MALTINDILANNEQELFQTFADEIKADLRVAMPGIIQSFNASEQTVTVQLSIRERIGQPDLTTQNIAIPLLVDVPIVLPRAGGFSLTLPIVQGDECLVVFGDTVIDSWWANGGVQNQVDGEKRRHDLSDGFAILGVWSQPHVLTKYSTTEAQLRTDDGSVSIGLSAGGVTITGDLSVSGSITAPLATIGGIPMTTHVHSDPQGGTTGAPQP